MESIVEKVIDATTVAAGEAGDRMRVKYAERVEEVKRVQREQYEEARLWRQRNATYHARLAREKLWASLNCSDPNITGINKTICYYNGTWDGTGPAPPPSPAPPPPAEEAVEPEEAAPAEEAPAEAEEEEEEE